VDEVDTGLRQLTQVDAGLRPRAIVQNEPTAADFGRWRAAAVDAGLPQLTQVDVGLRLRATVQNEPTAPFSDVTIGPDCR
jgi:hypothetical protein